MNKTLLIVVLWITFDFLIPISFAQTSTDSGYLYNPAKIIPTPQPYDWCNEHGCGYGDPSPTWPPERKCGACLESNSIKTKIEATQTPSPTPSGADVKGVRITPNPL